MFLWEVDVVNFLTRSAEVYFVAKLKEEEEEEGLWCVIYGVLSMGMCVSKEQGRWYEVVEEEGSVKNSMM